MAIMTAIARSMETTGDCSDVAALLAECIADVAAPPFEPYVYVPPDEATIDRWMDEFRDMDKERERADRAAYRQDKRQRPRRKHPERPYKWQPNPDDKPF